MKTMANGRVVTLLLAVAVAGCPRNAPDSASAVGKADVTATVGQAFRLPYGKTAALPDAGLRVCFDGVAEDSRCPTSVQCVWAGNARVALRLERAGANAVVDTTSLSVEPRAVTYAGYRISLDALEPAPHASGEVRPDLYIATLTVVRESR